MDTTKHLLFIRLDFLTALFVFSGDLLFLGWQSDRWFDGDLLWTCSHGRGVNLLAGDGAMLDFPGVQMHKVDHASCAILYGRLLIQK